jgi:cell division protein FtsL
MDLSVFPAQLRHIVRNSNAININWKNLPMCTLTVGADNKVSDAACGINEQCRADGLLGPSP